MNRQVVTTLYPATLISYKYELTIGFERGLRVYVKG